MKSLIAILCAALLAGGTGCAYRGHTTALQPGEKIIFLTPERAAQFRLDSANDAGNRGRVVEITRPTSLLTE